MTTAWTIAFILLSICILCVALIVLGVLRRVSLVLEQAEARLGDAFATGAGGPGGLAIGSALPSFEVQRVGGGIVTDRDLRGRAATILFLTASCPPCEVVARDLRRIANSAIPIYIVANHLADVEALRLGSDQSVLIQTEGQLSAAFETSATPHAFVFGSDGLLKASGTPNSGSALRRLQESVSVEEGGDAETGESLEGLVGYEGGVESG